MRFPKIASLACSLSATRMPAKLSIFHEGKAFKYNAQRCVAMSHVAKWPLLDDTPFGWRTYQIWHRVSTDGGLTYDQPRPVVQHGDEYFTPGHLQTVWDSAG